MSFFDTILEYIEKFGDILVNGYWIYIIVGIILIASYFIMFPSTPHTPSICSASSISFNNSTTLYSKCTFNITDCSAYNLTNATGTCYTLIPPPQPKNETEIVKYKCFEGGLEIPCPNTTNS